MKRLLLLVAALVAAPASAQTAPTIDGTLTDVAYKTLATDTGGPDPNTGFGTGNQINSLVAHVNRAAGTLDLGVSGVLQRNDGDFGRNYLVVLLDTKAGGYNTANFGTGGLGFSGAGVGQIDAGTTFDPGFLADYAVQIGCFTSGCAAIVYTLSGTRGTGGGPQTFGQNDSQAATADGAFRTFLDTANPNSRTTGFELRISTSSVITVDRQSISAFAFVTSATGFLSNQFLSPAASTQGNYGNTANNFPIVNFANETPDPVQLVFQAPADVARYRLLSPPVTGYTVGRLASMNLVQGIAEQYPTAGDNVYLRYTDAGYVGASAEANQIPSGSGFFWQLYDQDITVAEANSGGFGSGTSRSYELSTFAIEAGGTSPRSTLTFSPARNTTDPFYMIGNPFALPLAVAGVTRTAGGGDLGPLQAFNASNGSYQPLIGGQFLAPWQGVFAEINGSMTAITGAPTFQFDFAQTDASATPTFYGRTEALASAVSFTLAGTTASGAETRDEAAIVRLMEGASAEWDASDASKLTPPAGPYALLAPVGERNGAPYRLAVSSLPVEARTVRLAFLATDAGTYAVSWDGLTLPDGWAADLRDLATGATVDLRASETYTFTADATDWTERFELVLSQRGATASEAAPTEALRVLAARPNPARGTSDVTVELGESQTVRASVFDALGRRVQTLHDGQAAAGPLTLRIDASRLAPGVYVVRVEGASATASQTLTVVR